MLLSRDLFVVVSKGTVVFLVDPRRRHGAKAPPPRSSSRQRKDISVIAEDRLTEELYFDTLRSAASGTDILHLIYQSTGDGQRTDVKGIL